jgi:hypothetical protein
LADIPGIRLQKSFASAAKALDWLLDRKSKPIVSLPAILSVKRYAKNSDRIT